MTGISTLRDALNNIEVKDPCPECLVHENCSNACFDLIEYYSYLSKQIRKQLESIPGVTREHLERFERLEKRGDMLVKWWKKAEEIHD